ncbi:MAG: FHA domain-containing protein [Deltaproteobacteria bacterium]|nr:FHA domain-containing protein [Deltaproteobacteria bacterium]
MPVPPGLVTGGGGDSDDLKLTGLARGLFDLEVSAECAIVIPRAAGLKLGSRSLKPGERWLLRSQVMLSAQGFEIRLEPSPPASSQPDGTAALARGVLGGALGAPASSCLPSLVWLNGRDCGKRLTLLDEATFLGRGDGAAARVRDALASRTHAKLVLRSGLAKIVHLASANGLAVNDEKVDFERELFGGEVIRMGETELLFEATCGKPNPSALPASPPSESASSAQDFSAPTPSAAAPPAPRTAKGRAYELAIVGVASAAGAVFTAAAWIMAR